MALVKMPQMMAMTVPLFCATRRPTSTLLSLSLLLSGRGDNDKNSSSNRSRELTSNTSDGTEANVQVNAAEDVWLRLVNETFRLEEARLFGCLFTVSKKK